MLPSADSQRLGKLLEMPPTMCAIIHLTNDRSKALETIGLLEKPPMNDMLVEFVIHDVTDNK